ncbi:50S ribosomal protein L35 [Salinispora arenicola]|uniref:Large ribosomal subunit protein bL35 n=2 Tax=Salinispora arenicola TaxID=168697 RepID=RL35_SALAI|nr:50S ribosomal protein L35 [Salinispora arenicola]A8LY44.1 RecName: Full=Large ribosomal subunit protein bL35; AltName: Full=50S ribosomal protein L35 [Salinispora arenicola CNS-205]MCN0153639.1 50S ribosomal protein L35 [Salinispora arenicola]MCN0180560.1 50S ribosomal protein L35 [Salinispora arenicola]NIL43368.1 50S ribosomal protein L35 [Salinispora arenicola]NIL58131.1 50S ribosomal protein L35 [Salinispora arenicola]NIL61226.1 50S ribosomal protein L35 [Salinispora arenicola]
MPKMKSHTGMGKRVRVTGKGKIVKQQAGLRHNLEKKPSTRTRRLTGLVEVAKPDVKRIKKLLGR